MTGVVTVKRSRTVVEDITVAVVNGNIEEALDEKGDPITLTDPERWQALGMVADGLDETGL